MEKKLRKCSLRMAVGVVFLSVTCGLAMKVRATEKPEIPRGELLKAVPAFSEWEVVFSYPQDGPEAKAAERKDSLYLRQPRRSVVTKTGKIIHEVISRVNGEKVDRWQIDETIYIFSQQAGFWAMYGPEFQRNNRDGDFEKFPLPPRGFAGLDWISSETYVGRLNEGGKSFLVFTPNGASSLNFSDSEVLKSLPAVAFVDEETRLPVMAKENGIKRTFAFGSPPSQVLTLPSDLAADLKKAAEIEKNANRAPGREY